MVNRQRFERSLVVLPDRIVLDWPPNRFDDLAPEHLAALAGLDREIILLGTGARPGADRKSTRLNSSHLVISYAVFCLKKKKVEGYVCHVTFASSSSVRFWIV